MSLKKGLSRDVVIEISEKKNEPAWLLDMRLKALEIFNTKPMPTWGADLSRLDHQDIYYYLKPFDAQKRSWDDVPPDIRKTFDTLGIPQAEQKFLAGVGAQFESEIIYKSLKKEWADQGVIFSDIETAIREHPELVQKFFGTVVPSHDNKFAALNSAVWSGGSFVYVPEGVQVTMPLQAYFRINQEQMGQFERTLIIVEHGASVHYVEGCSAPVYNRNALHSAVVEIIAHEKSSVRYTTIQNWSPHVYNLVTKRAIAYRDARVSWVDGNFGSAVTMKYPAIILKEPGAHGEIISIAVAKKGQQQDSGGKVIHCAPRTTSHIQAKSLSFSGGRTSYRGLVKMTPQAVHAKAHVVCDALLLAADARTDTYPTMDIRATPVTVEHEAFVSKIGEEQLWYLQSRGLNPTCATSTIISGFVGPFIEKLPMEYAVEINRLIDLELEGSIG